MERLTIVGTGGGISEKTGVTREILRGRLAAYENTWLEPDEVAQICRAAKTMMFESVSDFVRYAIENFEKLQAYRTLGTIEELSALVKVRDDGPCGLCRYNPPSSFDGKPCTMCPAEAAQCEEGQYAD